LANRRLGQIGILVLAFLGAGAGLLYLDSYVHQLARQRQVQLSVEFSNPPAWASDTLIKDICLSSGIRQDDFILDEDLPAQWATNLAQNPWVKQVKQIHRRYDGRVQLDCELRRPIAKVIQSNGTFYLDAEGVVLTEAELAAGAGHLVELRGTVAAVGRPGETIGSAALMAGLQVLSEIRRVDQALPPQQRLWAELAALDVSNHEGRRDPDRPHLSLYTGNGIELRWGAAVGRSRPYREASWKEKIESLYRAHRQTGTLTCYQYVELRDASKRLADPVRQG